MDLYRLRPSAAGRWMNCPGSLAMEMTAPAEDEPGEAASEGQAAHRLAYWCLVGEKTPHEYLGESIPDDEDPATYWKVGDEMVEAVGLYLKVVRDLQSGADYTGFEQHVSYTDAIPLHGWCMDSETGEVYQGSKEVAGTADCIVRIADSLHIIDLKYGRNVVVEALDNPQLQVYALAALHSMFPGITDVYMHIVQPRAPHEDSPHRLFYRVESGLWEFEADMQLAVEQAGAPDAALNPAPDGLGWCRFCSARAECPARAEMARQASVDLAETAGTPPLIDQPIEEVTTETLGAILPKLDLIERFAKDVRAEALRRAESEDVPGYKRVAGRGQRKWRPDVTAQDIDDALNADIELEDVDPFKPRELRTVAQLETAVGRRKFREILADLSEKRPGNPKLVPESDPAEALGRTAENDFDAED